MAGGSVGIEGTLIRSQKQFRLLHVATKFIPHLQEGNRESQYAFYAKYKKFAHKNSYSCGVKTALGARSRNTSSDSFYYFTV